MGKMLIVKLLSASTVYTVYTFTRSSA